MKKFCCSFRSSRGVGDPLTLLALAAVGLVLVVQAPSGGPGKNHWWQFWKKNPVAAVQQTQADLASAKAAATAAAAAGEARIDIEKMKQLALAHEAAIATGAALAAAEKKAGAGEVPAREIATARQTNATNVQAMDQALGAAPPERIRELETMVANLNAGVAAGSKALELMQQTLDRTVADKAAAAAELVRIKAEGEAKVQAAETARDAAVKREGAFALERDALARRYERLSFFGQLAAALFVLVVAYVLFLLIRTRRLGAFAKDAVGMTEMLKREIASRASAEDYAAIKQRMANDWMTVHDGSAALVEKVKAELRL